MVKLCLLQLPWQVLQHHAVEITVFNCPNTYYNYLQKKQCYWKPASPAKSVVLPSPGGKKLQGKGQSWIWQMLPLWTSWRCLNRLWRLWEVSLWLLYLILMSNYCIGEYNCLSELHAFSEISWAVPVSLKDCMLVFDQWITWLSEVIFLALEMCTGFASQGLAELHLSLTGQANRQNEDLQLPPATKYYVFLGRSTSSHITPMQLKESLSGLYPLQAKF